MKKIFYLFFFASIVISGCIGSDDESRVVHADTFEKILINNTNLAPQFPGEPFGTGERVSGNIYWANNSEIDIYLLSHANTASQTNNIKLYINGTAIQNDGKRPLGSAEQTNTSVTARIPRGANYSAIFLNYHHYEWREYLVASGRNGTAIINQTVINQTIINSGGGGVSFNGQPVDLNGSALFNGTNYWGTFNHSNLSRLAWSQANHTMDTALNMSGNNITNSPIVNLKFNSTGGNLTGAFTEVRNDHILGNVGARDVDDTTGRTNMFFLLNRIFNETAVTFDNGTHMDRFGAALGMSSYTNQITLAWNYLLPNVTGIPNQVNIWLLNLNAVNGVPTTGVMSLPLQNMTLKVANWTSAGDSYICAHADGTAFIKGTPCV